MIRSQSFRRRLAARIGLTVSLLLLGVSLVGYAALREFLYRRLDGTVLRLAQIEAAATADSPDESVHFHDAVFLESGPGHEAILTRFAQVWTLEGEPVVRTKNLGSRDLPLPREVRTRAISLGQPILFSFAWQGGAYRAVLYPLGLLGPTHAPHLLQVAAATAETDTLLRQVLGFLAGLVIVGLAAGGGVGWWLSGYAVRPVLEIIHEAEGFKVSGAGHHITAHADTDEHRRLLAVLNALLGRVDEALASQRRFVADAGHAIKTPLTILRGDIDVALRRDRAPEEYRAVLGQALADLRDVSGLAEDLITLARSDGGALEADLAAIPVRDLLRKVVSRFVGAAERSGVRLEVGAETDASVLGDGVLLDRALSNLVDNAIKYGAAGGRVVIDAVSEGTEVEISVTDRGPGLDATEVTRVRQRFYRGAGAHGVGGSGLGLAIVDAVARAHGGSVDLGSNKGVGLAVRLRLRAGPRAGDRGPAGIL